MRSPIGKRNGGLSGVHPAELSAQVLNGLVERAGVDPGIVDDVILPEETRSTMVETLRMLTHEAGHRG